MSEKTKTEDGRPETGKKLSKTGLLPCPFCGSTDLTGISIPQMDEEASADLDKPQAACFVQCEHCYGNGPVRRTLKEARALWQTRSKEF